MGKPFRIISFDGGGVRGLYSVTLLDRLKELYPTLISDTDMLAGTSTGGLIALALACGYSPAEIASLYHNQVDEIFDVDWLSGGGLCGPRFEIDGLRRVAREMFGDRHMCDLSTRVVVPAIDLQVEGAPDPSWRLRLYTEADSDLIADVAIRTCAAPTYFAAVDGYVDGGVAANHPGLVAVASALAGGAAIDDIRLLSIGTGDDIQYIDGQDLDWGGLKWARPITSLMLDAQTQVADLTLRAMLGGRYHRLNTILPSPIEMDDTDRLGDLEVYARLVDLLPAAEYLTDHWGTSCPETIAH